MIEIIRKPQEKYNITLEDYNKTIENHYDTIYIIKKNNIRP